MERCREWNVAPLRRERLFVQRVSACLADGQRVDERSLAFARCATDATVALPLLLAPLAPCTAPWPCALAGARRAGT